MRGRNTLMKLSVSNSIRLGTEYIGKRESATTDD
jgi:hypothetical protein